MENQVEENRVDNAQGKSVRRFFRRAAWIVAALLVLGRAFGWRATAAFVLGVALTAIAIGLLIDFPLAGLIHVPGLTAPDHAHSHAAALWALIPLAALLFNGALRTHRHHHPHA